MRSAQVNNTGNLKGELIAPCGMNCALCVAYQFRQHDINQKGFHRSYCPGCLPRGENCLHMGDKCELLRDGKVRFCFECSKFPCSRLKALDKRYRTKYHLSMIENLTFIMDNGLDAFIGNEVQQWTCDKCGSSLICCHNGLCLTCDLEVLIQNKKYRWGE
ncbi:MAG: DUF3795 domain-containing protein [Anaerolineaceae bacterium]|nr:DUF3795 domain-containing protein [Anaerolineaceae bacterium]